MNLTISGHHLDVSPRTAGLRHREKLHRVLRHLDQVIDVKVLLSGAQRSERTNASALNAVSASKATPCTPAA